MKTPPMHPVLNGGTFGMMSGENPLFHAHVDASHENLVKTLNAMGLRHEQTQGRYGSPERSVLIHNPREDQMKTLGKLFGQESVIHSSGGKHKLIYTNGPDEGKFRGTVPAQQPHEWFEHPPEDYYTHLPGAGHFRINFDFDQPPQGENHGIKVAKSTSKSIFQRLKKALPRSDAENKANQQAFGSQARTVNARREVMRPPPGGAGPSQWETVQHKARPEIPAPHAHQVMTDALGGAEVAAVPGQPARRDLGWTAQTGASGSPELAAAKRVQDVNRIQDAGDWSPRPGMMPVSEPATPYTGMWSGDREDLARDTAFWAHPNFYEWHDGHTDHHNPRPWDKQNAMETARSLGLIKAEPVSEFPRFAISYGQLTPGVRPNLQHYDYKNKLQAVQDLVSKHGFKVYYAGGKHGKGDPANRNYNTGHLMVDPGPDDATNAWRQMHELAHALVHQDLNNVYGEGRRVGKLGQHRTMNEAMRAVHGEHLAALKQRELSKQIGVHIPDDVFNKEYNTIMSDAVHRVSTGQMQSPEEAGFTPHSHQVPLSHSLDIVRNEGKAMGLKHQHEKRQ